MPSPWNDSTDRQLLLTIIHLNAPKIDWKQVAAVMGEGFTDRSTSQHYAKIKKEFEQLIGAAPDSAGAAGARATSATPKKTRGTKSPGASGKRKKASLLEQMDDEEEEVYQREDTPVKKKSKVKAEIKPELEDDDVNYI